MSEEQLIPTPSVFGETGNFLLERELGRGGMGGVYMGRDKMLDRPVAVKVMLREYGSDADFVERFKKEAQACARLVHPNIAQVYSYGIADGMPYIAMELVAGGSLDAIMRNQGANTDVPRIMKLCEQVAQALRCAADQGLVHGDVKPENVLLDANGNAKLVDFGLSAMQKDTDEIWGTPYYIAPEKVKKEPVDYRADMYSLGGTIYHALTGVAPFEGDDANAVVRKRFEAPPKKPSEVRPGISPQIDHLVMKMLALNPADRYPSFEALLDDFKKVMATGLSVSSAGADGASAASAAPSGGGRRLVLKGKRKLTVRTATHLEPPVVDEEPGMQDEGEYGAPNRRPRLKTVRERRTLVESDGSEEVPKDNVGAKIALFVGGVIGVIVLVGLLLWWFVQSGESDAREKRDAAVQKTQDDVRASFAKTRAFAQKLQTDLDAAAGKAEKICEKQTQELRQVLAGRYTERVLDMLRPAPPKALIDAIASTNAAPAAAAAAGAAAAPAGAPAAHGTATFVKFREPVDDEADPNSPRGQKYLEEKAAWLEAQKTKATAAEAPSEAASADAQEGPSDTPPTFVVKKINEMWERAYAARAAEIRMHQELESLVREIDKAFADQLIENMTLETRQALFTMAQGFSEKYETIRNSTDWEMVDGAAARIDKIGEQQLKAMKDRLFREQKEAEREAEKKRLAEDEKKRLEALAAAKAKKIEEEIAAAKAKFQAIVDTGNIRQLDWKSARRTLEILKAECETAEGQLQVGQELKKIDSMELMQQTFVKNLKGYTFKRGALPGKRHLKGCTVTDVDMSSIIYLRKGAKKPVTLPWQTFLRDYHNNFDELITAFIVKNAPTSGDSKDRLSKKDRFHAITGVAFVLRIVCSDNPSSAGYAAKLLKDALKDYDDNFNFKLKQTKEFFPDIDLSDVEAEASTNNT